MSAQGTEFVPNYRGVDSRLPLLGDCSLASEAGDVTAMCSSRANGGYLVAQD